MAYDVGMLARPALVSRVRTALGRSPVTILAGPRQCGKTTLAGVVGEHFAVTRFDLEHPADLVALDHPVEALAGLRPRLLIDVTKLPGARLLDGQFAGVQQSIGTPKARAAAAEYLRAFVEEAKASGLVAEGIARSGVAGVTVAPPARP